VILVCGYPEFTPTLPCKEARAGYPTEQLSGIKPERACEICVEEHPTTTISRFCETAMLQRGKLDAIASYLLYNQMKPCLDYLWLLKGG
jgi:hypothetical protein